MSIVLNILMTDSCLNIGIFFNQSRMIDCDDGDVASWFDFLIVECKIKMTADRKQKIVWMIGEKNSSSVVAFHRCTMIETNLNALNWSTYHCNRLNDCFQWTIFNHLTYIFNQLQRRTARSWRIQDVVEQSCENNQKFDKQKEWWNRTKRWKKRWWLYIIM